GDVHRVQLRQRGEHLAEPGVVDGIAGGGGHVELQPRHGVVGDPADGVDVGADRGQGAGDRREGRRGDRAAEDHHGVGGRAAGCGDVVELALELHAELGGPVGEFPDDRDRATVRLDPDHEPQREVAVDDDLLDVDQVDVVG